MKQHREGNRDVPGRGRPTVILVNCVTAPVNAKPRITARRSVGQRVGISVRRHTYNRVYLLR